MQTNIELGHCGPGVLLGKNSERQNIKNMEIKGKKTQPRAKVKLQVTSGLQCGTQNSAGSDSLERKTATREEYFRYALSTMSQ